MVTDEEFEKFRAEERKKYDKWYAEKYGDEDLTDEDCKLPETTPRFPDWDYEEIAFYQSDGSILITSFVNDSESSRVNHGDAVYKPDNPKYPSVFEIHRFNERTDDYHWIVGLKGKVLGEGWGSDDSK